MTGTCVISRHPGGGDASNRLVGANQLRSYLSIIPINKDTNTVIQIPTQTYKSNIFYASVAPPRQRP